MENKLIQIIEAALLSASRPISIEEIQRLFPTDQIPPKEDIKETLNKIEDLCAERGVELKRVSSGYRMQVKQSLSAYIAKLWEEKPQRYSKATLETLALIAYRQPITRGEIEQIRGVSVGTQLIRGILERGWIKIVGQRDVPGRPSLYATTKEFLDYFGLQHLRELPGLPDLPDVHSLDMELPLEEEQKEVESQSDLQAPH
ncbi:MAG TPA: SMC-Scp complex subunit ScpB [Gammaproteobacteria bacterium]|jgi:segregation and condensation protein B|nr:SMC-Scp complex subunit ScpB [Gammaproteobacteria bacterium]HIB75703.1 SMC-Scp complex subunit ScpB [Gammaproteobacteria bacterium]HIG49305.1 SMC-Scp complex subunit ScpB [Gammaproteobacteria bacterium]HIN74470.1 SMC-Scp complex subunit ScpB [Gammaproteobacteria bacterium]HIO04628.1 SMC-Scp complex subunit ScpB [Gammaproteobacteria bacterium]